MANSILGGVLWDAESQLPVIQCKKSLSRDVFEGCVEDFNSRIQEIIKLHDSHPKQKFARCLSQEKGHFRLPSYPGVFAHYEFVGAVYVAIFEASGPTGGGYAAHECAAYLCRYLNTLCKGHPPSRKFFIKHKSKRLRALSTFNLTTFNGVPTNEEQSLEHSEENQDLVASDQKLAKNWNAGQQISSVRGQLTSGTFTPMSMTPIIPEEAPIRPSRTPSPPPAVNQVPIEALSIAHKSPAPPAPTTLTAPSSPPQIRRLLPQPPQKQLHPEPYQPPPSQLIPQIIPSPRSPASPSGPSPVSSGALQAPSITEKVSSPADYDLVIEVLETVHVLSKPEETKIALNGEIRLALRAKNGVPSTQALDTPLALSGNADLLLSCFVNKDLAPNPSSLKLPFTIPLKMPVTGMRTSAVKYKTSPTQADLPFWVTLMHQKDVDCIVLDLIIEKGQANSSAMIVVDVPGATHIEAIDGATPQHSVAHGKLAFKLASPLSGESHSCKVFGGTVGQATVTLNLQKPASGLFAEVNNPLCNVILKTITESGVWQVTPLEMM